MHKLFFLFFLVVVISMRAEASSSIFCLGLVKASKDAKFIGIVETKSVVRKEGSRGYWYTVDVLEKIKSNSGESESVFSWSDVRVYGIDKNKLIFVYEDQQIVAFDLEYFFDDGYVFVPRGGITYFMIDPETNYPSIPVYYPSLESKGGEVVNEISGNLIPLERVVENIAAAVDFDTSRCQSLNH